VRFLAGFLSGLVLVAVALAGAVYGYGAAFNVAAAEPHAGFASWAFSAVMQRSVKARAQAVTPPPVPPSQKIGEAFRNFNEMCVQCHGAPGREPSVVGKGLNPRPPPLSDAVRRWDRAELFWIVKNGIKMTGMPAFGPTHSDEELWLLVAFLERLPNTNPEQFKEMEEKFAQPAQAQQPRQGEQPQQGHRH
jgi:mono/diheme cytochrome c family protein